MTNTILCDVKDHIATITLNRPDKRNALNSEALHALAATLTQLEHRRDVRVVVIRGAGKTFCAGRDLRELSQHQDSGEREGESHPAARAPARLVDRNEPSHAPSRRCENLRRKIPVATTLRCACVVPPPMANIRASRAMRSRGKSRE